MEKVDWRHGGLNVDPIVEAIQDGGALVAEQGWCVVRTGVRSREAALALLDALASTCGPLIRHTSEGAFADVTTADRLNDRSVVRPQSDDGPLFPHTDAVLSPQLPAVLAMVCLENALRGGASILVDARPFLEEYDGDAQALAALFDGDAVAICRGSIQASVSVLRRRGELVDVALSSHEYNVAVPKPSCAAAFAALQRFAGDPARQRRVRLCAGDLLLVANRFCLHGREAFVDGARKRRHLLRGWYGGPVAGCEAFDGFVPGRL